MIKKVVVLILIVLTFTDVYAQQDVEKFKRWSASVDLVSWHLWRGTLNGDAPCIEPIVNCHINQNLTFSAWAAISVNHNYDEYDWIISYTKNDFAVILSDFYNPKSGSYGLDQYFNFEKGKTKHTIDLEVQFRPVKNFPLHFSVASFIAGDDLDKAMNRQFSTYVQPTYKINSSKVNMDIFIGITPWKGYYGKKLTVVNSGFSIYDDICLSKKYQLPFRAMFIYNPVIDKIAVSFAITIR